MNRFSKSPFIILMLALACFTSASLASASPLPFQPQRNSRRTTPQRSYRQGIENTKRELQRTNQRIKELTGEIIDHVGDSSIDIVRMILAKKGPDEIKIALDAIDVFVNARESTESFQKGAYWQSLSKGLRAAITILSAHPAFENNSYFKFLEEGVDIIDVTDMVWEQKNLRNERDKLNEIKSRLEQSLAVLEKKDQEREVALQPNRDEAPTQLKGKTNTEPRDFLKGTTEKLLKKIKVVQAEETGLIILDPDRGIVGIKQTPTYTDGYTLSIVSGKLIDWIANHPIFMRRILTNDLPPESEQTPIELSDGEVKSELQIPPGWIICKCPAQHPGLGKIFNGVQYHDPRFMCP